MMKIKSYINNKINTMKKISFYYVAPSGFIPHDENKIRKIYSDLQMTKQIGIIQIVSNINKEEEISTNTATVLFDKSSKLQKLIYMYVRDKKKTIKTMPVFTVFNNNCKIKKVKKVKRVLITDNIRKVNIYV